MNHTFNIELAKTYGIEESILIEYFVFWILKNKANDKNFYEGRYWTYNSAQALSELFPYMNPRTISRKINNLVEKGVLLKGNFNTSAYDRTCWYSFSDSFLEHLTKCGYPFDKMTNGSTKNDKPIPVIKTDKKPDNNKRSFRKTSPEKLESLFDPEKPEKPKKQKSNYPTLEEVKSYFQGKIINWEEEAEIFFYHFDSLGWRNINGTKIERWDSRANLWIYEKNKKNGEQRTNNENHSVARSDSGKGSIFDGSAEDIEGWINSLPIGQ